MRFTDSNSKYWQENWGLCVIFFVTLQGYHCIDDVVAVSCTQQTWNSLHPNKKMRFTNTDIADQLTYYQFVQMLRNEKPDTIVHFAGLLFVNVFIFFGLLTLTTWSSQSNEQHHTAWRTPQRSDTPWITMCRGLTMCYVLSSRAK